MKKTNVTITIWKDGKEGQREIPAYESSTPGLVVHKYVNFDGVLVNSNWIVTHAASGKAISPQGTALTTRKAALGFASEIANLVDWTKCEQDMIAHLTPELKRVIGEKIREVYRKYN